jgi:hypothetical protein
MIFSCTATFKSYLRLFGLPRKKNSLRKYVNTFEFDLPDWSGLGTAVLGLISSTFLILSVKTRQEAAANQMFAFQLGNRILNVYLRLGNNYPIRQ